MDPSSRSLCLGFGALLGYQLPRALSDRARVDLSVSAMSPNQAVSAEGWLSTTHTRVRSLWPGAAMAGAH